MEKLCINPKTLFNSTQYGFSQIVVTQPGRMVYISGQVAWDENQHLIGKDDLEKQTQKTLDNLELAIIEAGGALKNIVMLRIYLVNHQPENSEIVSRALLRKFGNQHAPAATWINVKGLANAEFLIEIEAQAVL